MRIKKFLSRAVTSVSAGMVCFAVASSVMSKESETEETEETERCEY